MDQLNFLPSRYQGIWYNRKITSLLEKHLFKEELNTAKPQWSKLSPRLLTWRCPNFFLMILFGCTLTSAHFSSPSWSLEKSLFVNGGYGKRAIYSCFRWQVFVVIYNMYWKIWFLYSLNQELEKLFHANVIDDKKYPSQIAVNWSIVPFLRLRSRVLSFTMGDFSSLLVVLLLEQDKCGRYQVNRYPLVSTKRGSY